MPDWPHAPPHRILRPGTYMVTAATYQKCRLFNTPEKLSLLHDTLLALAKHYQWELAAWAVFSNHYHFIAHSPENAKSLVTWIKALHNITARDLNRLDEAPKRRVWFQYWDKVISYQNSYYPRLKYVHNNAVHHRLVKDPTDYPWCSAAWFERNTPPSFRKSIENFKTDKLRIVDDF